jgi:hypothetical protein
LLDLIHFVQAGISHAGLFLALHTHTLLGWSKMTSSTLSPECPSSTSRGASRECKLAGAEWNSGIKSWRVVLPRTEPVLLLVRCSSTLCVSEAPEMSQHFFVCFYFFWHRVSLCSPGWSATGNPSKCWNYRLALPSWLNFRKNIVDHIYVILF